MNSNGPTLGGGQFTTTCQYCGTPFPLPISFLQVQQHSRSCPGLSQGAVSNFMTRENDSKSKEPKRRRVTFRQVKEEPMATERPMTEDNGTDDTESDDTLPLALPEDEIRERLKSLAPKPPRQGRKRTSAPKTKPSGPTIGSSAAPKRRGRPPKNGHVAQPRPPPKNPSRPLLDECITESEDEELMEDEVNDPEFMPATTEDGALMEDAFTLSSSSSEGDLEDEEDRMHDSLIGSDDEEFLRNNQLAKAALRRDATRQDNSTAPRQRRSGRLALISERAAVKVEPTEEPCLPLPAVTEEMQAICLEELEEAFTKRHWKEGRIAQPTKVVPHTPKRSLPGRKRPTNAVDRFFASILVERALYSRGIDREAGDKWFRAHFTSLWRQTTRKEGQNNWRCLVSNCSLSEVTDSSLVPSTCWRELSANEAARYHPIPTESIFLSSEHLSKCFMPFQTLTNVSTGGRQFHSLYTGGSVLDMQWLPQCEDSPPEWGCLCVSTTRHPAMELTTLAQKRTDYVAPASALQLWCVPTKPPTTAHGITDMEPRCQTTLCHDMGPCLQARWHPHPITSPHFSHLFSNSEALLLICPLFSPPRLLTVPLSWLQYNAAASTISPLAHFVTPKMGLHFNFNRYSSSPTGDNVEEFENKEVLRFGVVTCIEWPWQLSHLVALGTSEGYVAVWDLHAAMRTSQKRKHNASSNSLMPAAAFVRLNYLLDSKVHSVAFKPPENGRYLLVSLNEGQIYTWDRVANQVLSALSATQPIGGLFSGTLCPARGDAFLSVRMPFSGEHTVVSCYGHNWSLEHSRYNWATVSGVLTSMDFSDVRNTLAIGTEAGSASLYPYPNEFVPAKYKKKKTELSSFLFHLRLKKKVADAGDRSAQTSTFNTYEDVRQGYHVVITTKMTRGDPTSHDPRLHPVQQITKIKWHPNPSLADLLAVGTLTGFVFLAYTGKS